MSTHEQKLELKLRGVSLWATALVAKVHVAINDPITVLVGKNGAGKSAFVESLYQFSQKVAVRAPSLPCDISLLFSDQDGVFYDYTQRTSFSFDKTSKPPAPVVECTERCVFLEGDKPIWTVEHELLKYLSNEPVRIQEGIGLLDLASVPDGLPRAIVDMLRGTVLVPAGLPKQQKMTTTFTSFDERWKFFSEDPRLNQMCEKLATWHEVPGAEAAELQQLVEQLGLPIEPIRLNVLSGENEEKRFGLLLSGDSPISWLSAGSLRVIEILVALLDPNVQVLLIEEPETGIHPGLLDGLLSIIESYAQGRTVILTTHSHLVVSRATAESVRLVARHSTGTVIEELNHAQHSAVDAYLNDEGTLGEFLFDGA